MSPRRGASPPPQRGQLLPPPTGLGGLVVVDGGRGLIFVLAPALRGDDLHLSRGFNNARGGSGEMEISFRTRRPSSLLQSENTLLSFDRYETTHSHAQSSIQARGTTGVVGGGGGGSGMTSSSSSSLNMSSEVNLDDKVDFLMTKVSSIPLKTWETFRLTPCLTSCRKRSRTSG